MVDAFAVNLFALHNLHYAMLRKCRIVTPGVNAEVFGIFITVSLFIIMHIQQVVRHRTVYEVIAYKLVYGVFVTLEVVALRIWIEFPALFFNNSKHFVPVGYLAILLLHLEAEFLFIQAVYFHKCRKAEVAVFRTRHRLVTCFGGCSKSLYRVVLLIFHITKCRCQLLVISC